MKGKFKNREKELTDWFINKFPDKLENQRKVGFEKEYPVVEKRTFRAGDVRKIFPDLEELGWKLLRDDIRSDVIIGAEKNGVLVTTDAGYCTMEINMPPRESLWRATSDLEKLENFIVRMAGRHDLLILGYGIQPVSPGKKEMWVPKRRYDFLREALISPASNEATIVAADQVHTEITKDELVDATNVLNAFTGLLLFLFANSPVHRGIPDPDGRLARREVMWNLITDEPRIDIPLEKFQSVEHILNVMDNFRVYVAKNNVDYLSPGVAFKEFVKDYETLEKQWKYHEGTTWFDARPKTMQKTIEVRSVCSQGQNENSALAALVVGIVENLNAAKSLMNSISWKNWRQLKWDAIYGRVNGRKDAAKRMIDIAEEGLLKRGHDEEKLLEPLQDNFKENPAKKALEAYERDGIEGLVERVKI